MFYFSAHRSAEEFGGILPYFKGIDAYIFEEHNKSYVRTLQAVSGIPGEPGSSPFAGVTAEEVVDRLIVGNEEHSIPLKGRSEEIAIHGLFNSGVAVGGFDLRVEAELKKQIDKMLEQYPLYSDSNKTFEELGELIQRKSSLQTPRENTWVLELMIMIDALFTLPKFHNKPLNILAAAGSYHTGLYHAFKQAKSTEGGKANNMHVSRAFSHMPYYYSSLTESCRKFAFGRQPSKELLAQTYFELTIGDLMQQICTKATYQEICVYMRSLTASLTMEDIAHIHDADRYQALQQQHLQPEQVNSFLVSRGLGELPRSREELREKGEAFLAQRYQQFRALGTQAIL